MVCIEIGEANDITPDTTTDAREMGPIFFPAPEPSKNPYFLTIVPLARTVAPVRFAIASSASCHLANIENNPALELQSLRLRGRAISLMYSRLRNDESHERRGTLASMLVLAQLDVSRHRSCNTARS